MAFRRINNYKEDKLASLSPRSNSKEEKPLNKIKGQKTNATVKDYNIADILGKGKFLFVLSGEINADWLMG
jgi:hypothetical protein